jgi:hypothetical protein
MCTSTAMVDALDIKWDSLIQQDKQKSSNLQRSSAVRRYAAHHIFSRIGVSAAFAGDALVQKLKTYCHQQITDEATELASSDEAASGLRIQIFVVVSVLVTSLLNYMLNSQQSNDFHSPFSNCGGGIGLLASVAIVEDSVS